MSKKAIVNIVCGIAAIGLLVAGYFMFVRQSDAPINLGYTLINVSPDEVERVIVRMYDFEFTLENWDGEWSVFGDDITRLDQALVREFVQSAASVVSAERVSEGETDLAQFGLGEPSGVVEVRHYSGEPHTLQIGDLDGEYYFVNTFQNPGNVYTLHESRVTALLAPIDELRDRAVSPLSEDEITHINITREVGGEVEEIAMDMLDDTTAANITFRLATLRIAEFVEFGAVSLSDVGLDEPNYIIEFGNSERRFTLYIGRRDEERGLSYARVEPNYPNAGIFMLSNEDISFKDMMVRELVND